MQDVNRDLLTELQRCVRGKIVFDCSQLESYSTDFGGLRSTRPSAVVPVESETELSSALRVLYKVALPVVVRGGGLSCHGRTVTDGVILQNYCAASHVEQIAEDTVVVSGRVRWAMVIEELKRRWLTPRVLTYSLSPTVGGTLSSGGYGAASIRAGAQVDHVRRLRLVLPDGSAVWCSPEENASLFRCALGGLGRVGIIERAEIAVEAYRPFVRVQKKAFNNLASTETVLLQTDADLFFVESRDDEVHSQTGYWAGIEHVFGTDEVVPADFFQAGVQAVHTPETKHIWCDYFVNPSGLGPILRFLDSRLPRTGLNRIQVLAIRNLPSRSSRAFLPLTHFESDRYFGIGVFYSVNAADTNLLKIARNAQRSLLHECLRLGGRPYLCGAHDLDEQDLEAIYQEDFFLLRELCRQQDPEQRFNQTPAQLHRWEA